MTAPAMAAHHWTAVDGWNLSAWRGKATTKDIEREKAIDQLRAWADDPDVGAVLLSAQGARGGTVVMFAGLTALQERHMADEAGFLFTTGIFDAPPLHPRTRRPEKVIAIGGDRFGVYPLRLSEDIGDDHDRAVARQ